MKLLILNIFICLSLSSFAQTNYSDAIDSNTTPPQIEAQEPMNNKEREERERQEEQINKDDEIPSDVLEEGAYEESEMDDEYLNE